MNKKKEGVPVYDENGVLVGEMNIEGEKVKRITRVVRTFPPSEYTFFDANGNKVVPLISRYSYSPL